MMKKNVAYACSLNISMKYFQQTPRWCSTDSESRIQFQLSNRNPVLKQFLINRCFRQLLTVLFRAESSNGKVFFLISFYIF